VTHWDLVVVGAGPAGSAAALRARTAGLNVTLVVAPDRGPRTIESLPPAGRRLLADLGCWSAFLASGPTPSRGARSYWGSELGYDVSSLHDPDGPGWLVDRVGFDAMLRATAASAGTVLRTGRLRGVVREPTGLRLALSDGSTVTGRFVIDATGRSSAVAARLGARRRHQDRTVAELRRYRSPAADRRIVIAAVADGWWYSLGDDSGSRLVGRIVDYAGSVSSWTGLPEGIAGLLDRAEAKPGTRRVAANSAWLEPFAGPDWAAAGDAALSFDPLSSQGLLTALFTGRSAADAADAVLSGRPDAPAHYAARLAAIRDTYRRNLAHFYRMEQRWPHAPFWAARQELPTSVPGLDRTASQQDTDSLCSANPA
jgi:flavin-dependent dehydrogenase